MCGEGGETKSALLLIRSCNFQQKRFILFWERRSRCLRTMVIGNPESTGPKTLPKPRIAPP